MRHLFKTCTLFIVFLIPWTIRSADRGDVAKGKEIYKSHCAVCHGNGGEGNEAMGKALGVKMPVLGSREVQSQNDAVLKKIILKGKGKMQPVALSSQELDHAIAFLRILKK